MLSGGLLGSIPRGRHGCDVIYINFFPCVWIARAHKLRKKKNKSEILVSKGRNASKKIRFFKFYFSQDRNFLKMTRKSFFFQIFAKFCNQIKGRNIKIAINKTFFLPNYTFFLAFPPKAFRETGFRLYFSLPLALSPFFPLLRPLREYVDSVLASLIIIGVIFRVDKARPMIQPRLHAHSSILFQIAP